MFNSEWLDIAISVVLVWFLFALVVSAVNEGVVRLLAIRSKQLWRALAQMLDGSESPTGLLRNVAGLPAWKSRPANPHPGGGSPVTDKLYATAAIQALENRTRPDQPTRIHDIPATVFSQSLLELTLSAHGEGPIDKIKSYVDGLGDIPLKAHLQVLLATANNDVNQFRAGVERWFNGQMSRLSAIYRAQVRIILALLGILVAVAGFGLGLRSDALRLVSDLQHDRDLRTLVVGAATDAANSDLAKAGGCDPATAPNRAACQLKGVSTLKNINLSFHDSTPTASAPLGQRFGFLLPWRHWRAFVGVLITGVAISFGSSFWYNILKRLVGLRGTGQASAAS